MRDKISEYLNQLEELILRDEYDVDDATSLIDRIRDLVGECYED